MRAVIQRVDSASVNIGETTVGSCGRGFLILLGVGENDTKEEVGELADVLKGLYPESGEKADRKIVLDFSIVGDTNYYNGMAFEGYIEGIPECVLIGGRYDKLMRRMKKKSRAIGFAIYMDTLGMLGRTAGDRAIENFYDR